MPPEAARAPARVEPWPSPSWPRTSLLAKYAAWAALLVSALLAASGVMSAYLAWRETTASQTALLVEKAQRVALRIAEFASGIEQPLAWAVADAALESAHDPVPRRLELVKLLQRLPAVTDLRWIDAAGHERVLVSRLALDAVGSLRDFSTDPAFLGARKHGRFLGRVAFRKGTEPYLTLGLADPARSGGALLAEVNLKFVSDVVARERIGATGIAYVVDEKGELVSHSDVSQVLRRAEVATRPHVRAALARGALASAEAGITTGLQGATVLEAAVPVAALGWTVFVEQPTEEALAGVYRGLWNMALLLFVGLVVAVASSIALATRLVRPIRALERGARAIGAGRLDQRIEVRTGDELEALGEQFNRMAARLQDTYAGLEARIAERTRELSAANEAKSRFLAAASHDLRQPMQALVLFADELRHLCTGMPALAEVSRRINDSVDALRGLLDALLDLSKLDAGAVTPEREAFALAALLERLATQFAPTAEARGVRLRVHPTALWVESDPRLLERILLNLVANAVRYTDAGRVVIGCRRRGREVEIVVADTGVGIAAGELPLVFREFYRAGTSPGEARDGLGLGLAIVDRLARVLGHRVRVRSQPGKGSAFGVRVPLAPAGESALSPAAEAAGLAGLRGLVVDDDEASREAMVALLARWGCAIDRARDAGEAGAMARARAPDFVVCDLRLGDGESGYDLLDRLNAGRDPPPACVIVTGDWTTGRSAEAAAHGYPVLAKPLSPARLRALLEQLLRERAPR